MIKITNNKETKVVTTGAYNSFYKRLGFEIVSDKKQASTKSDNKEVEKPVVEQEPQKEKIELDNKKSEKKSGTENVVEKKNEKRK